MTHQLTPAASLQNKNILRLRTAGNNADTAESQVPVAVTLSTRPGPDTIRAWDRLVRDTPRSDVAQLSAWSNLRRLAGFRPRYVLARQGGRLVGGALVLQRRLPVVGELGYVPYGPVIAAGEPRAAPARALSTALADLGHRHLSGLFVQPPHGADDISNELVRRGFRPSVAGIAPAASIAIDLTRDVEDIRNGLTKSNRRSISSSAARGITVRLGGERDLPQVADLLARTAAHQHFDPLSLDYIRTMYRELSPGDHIKVFIAELGGASSAVELFTGCGGVLTSRLTGTDRSGPARKSGAAAALEWHAIVWAKSNGYHTIDFGGLAANAVDTIRAGEADLASHLAGPDFFKASFGGQPFHYPLPVELISSPLVRISYDLARHYPAGGKLVATVRRTMRGGADQ